MCDERSVGDEVDGTGNGDGTPDVTGQCNRGATGRVDVVGRIDAFYATGCIVAFEAPRVGKRDRLGRVAANDGGRVVLHVREDAPAYRT